MSFTKLDRGILQSSMMAESSDTFKVWIVLLAACDSDGVARVSSVFISSVSHLPLEAVKAALARLSSPDPESRSLVDEGRRIRRDDGGYELINYKVYRTLSLRDAEAERKRLYRQGNPSLREEENERRRSAYRERHPTAIPSEEEAEGEAEKEKEGEGEPSARVLSRPDTKEKAQTTPPLDSEGLLPIPEKDLSFDDIREFRKMRADIRRCQRLLNDGKFQDGPERLTQEILDRRKAKFIERIMDLS